jgi:hypothetical protein
MRLAPPPLLQALRLAYPEGRPMSGKSTSQADNFIFLNFATCSVMARSTGSRSMLEAP